MEIKDIYEKYKLENSKKRVVFCHFQNMTGFQFNNLEEFESFVNIQKKPIYIINSYSNKTMDFYEFFQMEKVLPYLVLIKHPLGTNAYYKALPDKIIDSYVSPESNIYRYLYVEYEKSIKEYVIELPQNLDNTIFKMLQKTTNKSFFKKSYSQSSISLIFTNSNRYKLLDESNFIILPYNEIYKDWDIKTITSENISKKLWKDIISSGN